MFLEKDIFDELFFYGNEVEVFRKVMLYKKVKLVVMVGWKVFLYIVVVVVVGVLVWYIWDMWF